MSQIVENPIIGKGQIYNKMIFRCISMYTIIFSLENSNQPIGPS